MRGGRRSSSATVGSATAPWRKRPIALAAGLLGLGIGRGDAVALYLPNTPWHPVSFFALARTGARIVHLSALDAPRELAHKLQDSGARTLIATNLPGLLPTALRLLEEGRVDRVLVGEDARWGEAPCLPVLWSARRAAIARGHAACVVARAQPDELCLLQYTGGTTGLPKAAMLSHRNLTAAVSMYRLFQDGAARNRGEHRVIAVLPLFHIYALTCVMLRHFAEGNELLLRSRFDVETLLEDIGCKRATVFPGVPTMWIGLLNHPKAAALRIFLAALLHLRRGADAVRGTAEGDAPDRAVPARRLGHDGNLSRRHPYYPTARHIARADRHSAARGSTCASSTATTPRACCRPARPAKWRSSGPNVFRGYWNRPEENSERLPRRLVPDRRYRRDGRARAVHLARPQEEHDHLERLQRLSGGHRERDP